MFVQHCLRDSCKSDIHTSTYNLGEGWLQLVGIGIVLADLVKIMNISKQMDDVNKPSDRISHCKENPLSFYATPILARGRESFYMLELTRGKIKSLRPTKVRETGK